MGPTLLGPDHVYKQAQTDPGMFSIIYAGATGVMQSFDRRRMPQDQMLRIIAYVRTLDEMTTPPPRHAGFTCEPAVGSCQTALDPFLAVLGGTLAPPPRGHPSAAAGEAERERQGSRAKLSRLPRAASSSILTRT